MKHDIQNNSFDRIKNIFKYSVDVKWNVMSKATFDLKRSCVVLFIYQNKIFIGINYYNLYHVTSSGENIFPCAP